MAKKGEKKVSEEAVTDIDALTRENEEIIKENEELKASNEQLNNEIAEQKDTFIRTVAEYDNYRKRTSKEKEEAYTFAKADAVSKLIPAIDTFERAAGAPGDNLDEYKKGIEMTYRQIMEILAALGVEHFGESGDEFNPDLHNAVMHKEDESFGENTVCDVLQKGYKIGDKVIRPAMVSVAN